MPALSSGRHGAFIVKKAIEGITNTTASFLFVNSAFGYLIGGMLVVMAFVLMAKSLREKKRLRSAWKSE